MVDMGVEPFLIRSSVIGILAQRLVRILCPHCKVPYEAKPYELEQLGLTPERIEHRRKRKDIPGTRYYPREAADSPDPLDIDVSKPVIFHRNGGCDKCGQTGFSGRRGIYELLLMDDAISPLILQNADAQTVKRAAFEQGMDSLRDDGARKVLAGLTTADEVLAATQEDFDMNAAQPGSGAAA
jgi:general secretion pathway protein E